VGEESKEEDCGDMGLNIEVLEQKPFYVKLKIKDIPLHILNAIRRCSISEVPVMAVDSVVFTVNSSVFYDEIVAHRIGLIPLTSEEALEKYRPPEECKEAAEEAIFTEDCFVKFDLEVSNPPENSKPIIVYSKELRTGDPDVRPVYDTIPLLILGPGQEIRLEAYARLGRGKEHAKWSPVSVAAHRYIADINIDYNKCMKDCTHCIDVCPKGIFKQTDKGVVVQKDKLEECILCRVCELECPARAIKVGWKKNEYILIIESTGALSPKRILIESSRILESKLDELLEKLREAGVVK